MDNKKWYKRISTCFWFLLAVMPLLVSIIHFIGFHLAFNSGIATSTDLIAYQSDASGKFDTLLQANSNFFGNLCPSFLLIAFTSLFGQFLSNATYISILSKVFSWFCWVYFIELMVDFVVWLPRMCHSWMERWCKD